tara:strand:+ start:16189 stop:16989 length:801 start_codon:yes stop_codon:yes gene_type:complete
VPLNIKDMSETLIINITSGVQQITLNRPNSYNSFNKEMALSLQKAIEQGSKDESVRSILITGKGKAFSSGQDLQEAIDPLGPGLDKILSEHFNPLVRQIRETPKPIIFAVNGIAAGAGANLALAGDIVVASEQASFIQAFSKIGLIPDSGGTYILPRLVGFAKASAWMMMGDKIDSQEALSSGLIYKVFPEGKLLQEAMSIAEHLANQPTAAFAGIKMALNKSILSGLDEQLEFERELQNKMGKTQDFNEGVAAFLEKRKPKFKGK